jgi:hypothetical protein
MMTVSSVRVAWNGKIGNAVDTDYEGLRRMIGEWGDWAMSNSALRRAQEASCS